MIDVFIAMKLEEHFFVGVDNGLVSLLSDENPMVVQLTEINSISTFPEKDIFASAAGRLASGTDINTLGKLMTSFKKLVPRQLRQNGKGISGNVIRIDSYGNLLNNISRAAFEAAKGNRAFTVQFGGRKSMQIHNQYFEAGLAEHFLVFNSLGLLEIGMYRCHAGSLLGLGYDSSVNIVFAE